MADRKSKVKAGEPEKTFIKALGLNAFTLPSEPSAIDVKNGKIIRVRPLHYDWKYTREHIKPWKIERNGKTFEPTMKALPSPLCWLTKSEPILPTGLNIP